MKTTFLILLAAVAAMAQTHSIQLCDQQSGPHCVTITVPSSLSANAKEVWPSADAAGVLTNDGAGNLSWATTIPCPTCLTTSGGQTITGTDTWTVNQAFRADINIDNSSGTLQWQIGSPSSNELAFLNSSGSTVMYLTHTGTGIAGGTSDSIQVPATYIEATTTDTPTLFLQGRSSQTADLLDVYLGATKAIDVNSSGAVQNLVSSFSTTGNGNGFEAIGSSTTNTLTPLGLYLGGGTVQISSLTSQACIGTDSSGNVQAGTCGYTATSPITITGSVIACSDCMTLSTNQTVTGTKTFNASIEESIINTHSVGSQAVPFSTSNFNVTNTARINLYDQTAGVDTAANFWYMVAQNSGSGNDYIEFVDGTGAVKVEFETEGGGVPVNNALFGYNIISNSPGTYNLGASGNYWNEAYIVDVNASAIYMGSNLFVDSGRNTTTGALTVGGTLTLSAYTSIGCLGTNSSGAIISGSCGTTYSGSSPINVSGTVISCSTCLTTSGGQAISGTDTWTVNQNFNSFLNINNSSGTLQWQIGSPSSNELAFLNSSGSVVMYLTHTGTGIAGGTSDSIYLPAAYVEATTTSTPTLYVQGRSGQTADFFDIYNGSGVSMLSMNSSGGITVSTTIEINGSGGSGFEATNGSVISVMTPLSLSIAGGKFSAGSTGAITELGGVPTTGFGAPAVVYSTVVGTNGGSTAISATSTGISAAGTYRLNAQFAQLTAATCTTYPLFIPILLYSNGSAMSPLIPTYDTVNGWGDFHIEFGLGTNLSSPFYFVHDGTSTIEWELLLGNSPSCSNYGTYKAYVTLERLN